MIDGRPQLQLFESSMSSSRSAAPSSPPSNAPETSSSALATSTTTAASSSDPTIPATGRSSRAGAGAAATSKRVAIITGAFAPQPTLPIFTGQSTADRMLSVPRPKTRAACRAEARPCPWVGCRHHLLLEVARPRGENPRRPTSIRLNLASRDRTHLGRRPGLRSSAAARVVQMWIDDAVEALSRMRYTCSLDVAEAYPDGLPDHALAQLLGCHEQLVDAEARIALRNHRNAVRETLGLTPRDH